MLQKILKKPELVFVLIASLFGVLSAIMMPILEVPDENQHFQVSYAIFSENRKVGDDMVFSDGMLVKQVEDGNYWSNFTEKNSAADDGVAINTGSRVFDQKTPASIFDIMRLPQALGVLVGKAIYPSLGIMVLMGRLFVLAVFIVAMYFIIKKLNYGKWALVFIATFPIVIQQAASLSYDAINMVAIFAWVAFCINLATQKTRISLRQILIGVGLALFILASKSNNVLLFVLLLALPLTLISPTALYKKLQSNKYWLLIKIVSISFIIIVLLAAVYVIQLKLVGGNTFDPKLLGSVLLKTYLWGDLELIDVTTIGTVGQFGNFYYHLPMWTVILTYIVLAIVMLSEKIPNVSRRFALVSLGLFFASVVLISVGMYYGWAIQPERLGPGATVTDGIQGRYFTPLLILLLAPIAYIQKYIKITVKNPKIIPVLVTVMSVLLLSLYIAQTFREFWK